MINLLTHIPSAVLNYNVQSSTTKHVSVAALAFLLIAIIFGALIVVSTWKVFTKAGKPGWAAIVPVYQTYILFEIADYPGWWGLVAVLVLSFGNITHVFIIISLLSLGYFILIILVSLKIAEKFGKSLMFAIFGLVIFPFVGYPILAFGDAQYKGVSIDTPKLPSTPKVVPTQTVTPTFEPTTPEKDSNSKKSDGPKTKSPPDSAV